MNPETYPRVLIVSHTVLAKNTSMGKTMDTYFSGWPRDRIAQLYIQSEVPTDPLCANYFRFTDPGLDVKCEGDEIVVSAKHFAKSIEIRNEHDDLLLNDNFFDLNGGEKRVKVLNGHAEQLEVMSVYSIR